MYRKILVPLDGSEAAEAIIPHVANLAKYDGAQVIFAQVIEPATRSGIINIEQDQEVTFKPQKIDEAKNYLTRWQEQFAQDGLSADILLLRGVAVDAILHAIEQMDIDVLAFTSQGRSGLKKAIYGSVSAALLNRAPCPMLVADSKTKVSLKTNNRILVPLDGSKESEKILSHVQHIAQLYEAKLILVRVVRSASYKAAFVNLDKEIKEEVVPEHLLSQLGKHQELEKIKEAKKYLLNWKSQFQEQGIDVEVNLLYGQPIDSILAVAERSEADLVAMTSQAKAGLDEFLYGSVASGLLNRLGRPMFIIHEGKIPVRNFA
ncbi:universal stress protein [Euhalothece natronophila Z-M001]|uniref:Universal stress protein n=1 Tax=Euhalothece natronophila Z-M001 TaxID=522448 RepID=A0A5B8NLE3_9CHRO|nr:universal stress protein [Euhalothece natronophila]QDZ39836.1 universal stress protein [Euhalothece natronophila Z-M001]